MQIREYRATDLDRLFEYWKQVGAEIPYFFPVSAQRWQACLLQDELDGCQVFKSLNTYLATGKDRILGFVQCGQPNFAWDETGQRTRDPQIGVIRHLFFERERTDVGEALLAEARRHLAGFGQRYAFYHALGVSCNARHGKLHCSQSHVDQLLRAHRFRIEHENAYYVLDMRSAVPVENPRLELCSVPGSNEERFEVRLEAKVVGTASVRYLGRLTGGHARDTAYLTRIGVVESHRSQGLGAEFLQLLVRLLSHRQVRYLHTDTAGDNVRAQRFYAKLGFHHQGHTRSYVQASGK